MKNNNNLSIYIHTPFCKSKCNYCNFYSINPENINGAELQKIYNTHRSPNRSHNYYHHHGHDNSPDNSPDNIHYNSYNNIHDIYLQSLIKELKIISEKYNLNNNFTHSRIVKTIYFGGGTPSVMNINFFDEIINNIYKTFAVSDNPEITVEVNPESAVLDKLKSLRSLGINRLSIGAQSFNDNVLKIAGRLHSSDDILRCVNDSRKCGFNNISLDLMLGLPGQTAEILQKDIDYLISIRPEHISAYILSIEKGSKFYKNLKKLRMRSEENRENNENEHNGNERNKYEHSKNEYSKNEHNENEHNKYEHSKNEYNENEHNEYKERKEDELADFYITASEEFSSSGYKHYEISNFALNGFESKHNINYWERGEYIGLGPAASSFIKQTVNCSVHNNADNNSSSRNIDDNRGDMDNNNYYYRSNNRDIKKLEIRITNKPNLIEYINKISNFEKKILQSENKKNKLIKYKIEEFKTDEEILTKKNIINEKFFLSLRTYKGINVKIIYKYADRKIIDELIKAGFAEIYATGDRLHMRHYLRLTLKGMLVSSEIFSKILL
ncbi:MAG: coproporphyrinogen III oxidase family protein [Candidatus Acididesulfobacter guangdongensis]|uniref:Coproporphyrinogen III oxidase family protein n=1 Tax=Acididesulfobacter guangdongensis TaxID=2597225 RepID=A0A519BI14_ACIG2|nr:MAG: coproporphyrinogen III oxidase family protein [Candidatus Acididesulfobacter guangdongensis]